METWRMESSLPSPTRIILPAWLMGGLLATLETASSDDPPNQLLPLLFTWPTMCTWLSEPGETWMYPAPVDTWSVTGPFTVSVRSKDLSAANATAGRHMDMATRMPAAALRDGFHRVCIVALLGL